MKEIRAKAGGPIWRRDGETGQTYALKLTAAGAKAIAVDETGPSEGEAERRPDHPIISVDPKAKPGSDPAAAIDRPDSGVAPTPISPRGGTKIAQVIELLQRGVGATLAELIAATGWLPHTMRAALTGLRKRGYAVGTNGHAILLIFQAHEWRSRSSGSVTWAGDVDVEQATSR